mmetsp:Transcript_11443/g.31692  ORF Transcript_11443/g.31692 Transcript_11443/m.31692 type:complete len:251 (-) Transcript_11443:65-817(-)
MEKRRSETKRNNLKLSAQHTNTLKASSGTQEIHAANCKNQEDAGCRMRVAVDVVVAFRLCRTKGGEGQRPQIRRCRYRCRYRYSPAYDQASCERRCNSPITTSTLQLLALPCLKESHRSFSACIARVEKQRNTSPHTSTEINDRRSFRQVQAPSTSWPAIGGRNDNNAITLGRCMAPVGTRSVWCASGSAPRNSSIVARFYLLLSVRGRRHAMCFAFALGVRDNVRANKRRKDEDALESSLPSSGVHRWS